MRILLLEDEAISAERLLNILKAARPNWEFLGVLASIREGVNWFEKNAEPDLIFSDIQLQDGLSFELFKKVGVSCPIIFTTAYDQYVMRAFEVTSVDYLLKPIVEEKVSEALKKLEDLGRFARKDEETLQVDKLMEMIQKNQDSYKSRFMVKGVNKIVSVPTAEVAYFEARNKLTYLVQKEGSRFPVDYSLDELESLVDPKGFFRVNRSTLIQLDAAKEIKPYFKGRLKLELEPPSEEEIVVSSEKSQAFKSWLDQ